MTYVRAMRLALGLTLKEMAEFIYSNIDSISRAERFGFSNEPHYKYLDKIYTKESNFIKKVLAVLVEEDVVEVRTIAAALIQLDDRRDEFKGVSFKVYDDEDTVTKHFSDFLDELVESFT